MNGTKSGERNGKERHGIEYNALGWIGDSKGEENEWRQKNNNHLSICINLWQKACTYMYIKCDFLLARNWSNKLDSCYTIYMMLLTCCCCCCLFFACTTAHFYLFSVLHVTVQAYTHSHTSCTASRVACFFYAMLMFMFMAVVLTSFFLFDVCCFISHCNCFAL